MFILSKCVSASSSGLPAYLGLKWNQFNCGLCGTPGAIGAFGGKKRVMRRWRIMKNVIRRRTVTWDLIWIWVFIWILVWILIRQYLTLTVCHYFFLSILFTLVYICYLYLLFIFSVFNDLLSFLSFLYTLCPCWLLY